MSNLLTVYKQIAGHAADMESARDLAESKLDEITPQLIGRRIQVARRGTFQICSARIGWDGRIEVRG